MTFCKCLFETNKGSKTVSAWENWDKFSKSARYEICVSVDGLVMETYKTARTTWSRKFNEVCSAI